jgi:signal transduction histidine kinase
VEPTRQPLSRVQLAGDVLLAAACTGLAMTVHLSGSQAVAANAEPSAFSVALTVLATAPLALRRRFPLVVLATTLVALDALVATRNTVGMSTLGPVIAFYTALASGPRRQGRAALTLMTLGIAVGALLQPVDLSTEGAAVNAVVLVGAWVLASGVRERREHYEADVLAAQQRAAASAAEERLRITRELHDLIGHAMGVMVVQAGVAERLLDTRPEEARRAVAEIGATGRASLAEMRQVLGALREDDRDGGGPMPRDPLPTLASLPTLVERVESAGLPVELVVRGVRRPLPPGLDLAAYRIVQEALTNCLKHARASRAWVTVDFGTDAVGTTIRDDGTATLPSAASAGHGLDGMRERVAVFGGELSVGPRPGGGFEVRARFPIPAPDTTAAARP